MADPVLENQFSEQAEEAFDTSDKEQVNKARKKYARKRADRLKVVQAMMQHPEGRGWFYDILTFCKVFQTPFKDDPYRTAFSCGEQNIGLRIMEDIQIAAPKQYLDMINENKGTVN